MSYGKLWTLLLLCTAFASHAQWQAIVQNTRNDIVYFDPTQIVRNGDNLHVRIYSNFADFKPSDAALSQSSMSHISINCKKKTFSVLQIVDFDEANLQGRSRPKNFPYPKISAIPPQSSIREIEQTICR